MITTISPSSINTFDESTSFGCERRWYYKYVEKRVEPEQPHLQRGVRFHALIEKYLKGEMTGEAQEGEEVGLFLAGQHIIDKVKPLVRGVEVQVSGLVADIPLHIKSKCDVVLADGILDWKTSSDIRRYGKTPEQLAVDNQLVIYARCIHPTLEHVRLAHGYFQTAKGRSRSELVETVVTKKHLDDHYENVIVPLVAKMKLVSEVGEATSVKPNLNACRKCPHAAYCPQDKKESPVVSFFNRFKQAQQEVAAPQPVLPPDAPKSEPALAAEPVQGFSPIPPPKTEPTPEVRQYAEVQRAPTGEVQAVTPVEPQTAKRGPGRPKGAKNKPKMQFVDVPSEPPVPQPATVVGTIFGGTVGLATTGLMQPPLGQHPQSQTMQVGNLTVKSDPRVPENKAIMMQAAPNPRGFTVTSVTYSKGLKVGLPGFSSIDFHVSMTAEGEDYEATFAALKVEVEKRLEAEMLEADAMKKSMKAEEKK
jgi:hypothetical protein